jgi:hypothetical protein
MSLPKGAVQPNAAMTNSYLLIVLGLPDTVWKSIGALKEELITATMADQTVQSTAVTKAVSTEGETYAHHTAEIIALEAWWLMCKTGAPLHKRAATVHLRDGAGTVVRSYLLDGMMITGRELPQLDAGGEGSGALIKWSLSIDAVIPL